MKNNSTLVFWNYVWLKLMELHLNIGEREGMDNYPIRILNLANYQKMKIKSNLFSSNKSRENSISANWTIRTFKGNSLGKNKISDGNSDLHKEVTRTISGKQILTHAKIFLSF